MLRKLPRRPYKGMSNKEFLSASYQGQIYDAIKTVIGEVEKLLGRTQRNRLVAPGAGEGGIEIRLAYVSAVKDWSQGEYYIKLFDAWTADGEVPDLSEVEEEPIPLKVPKDWSQWVSATQLPVSLTFYVVKFTFGETEYWQPFIRTGVF